MRSRKALDGDWEVAWVEEEDEKALWDVVGSGSCVFVWV